MLIQIVKIIYILLVIQEDIKQQKSQKMFKEKYIEVQVIKQQKSKKTSIVTDKNGKFLIAKRITINNAQINHEIEMLKSLKHPNLVNIHEAFIEQNYVYLIEEYCEEGDLAYHMLRRSRNKRKHYAEQTIANWILQILMVLQYMHKGNVIHRDIRPDNIMLTAKGNLKLGSLKFSKVLEIQQGLGLAFTVMTSPYYSAPQCIEQHGYTEKVDIWAVGCLIQQLCTLKTMNLIQSTKRSTKGKVDPLPLLYSSELNEIYTNCLKNNPNDRPTAQQLLKSPYFMVHMRNFILKQSDQPKQQVRIKRKIPIKRYKIHKMNEEKKKIQQFRQLNAKRMQNIQKTSNYLMKKSSLDQNRYKMSSKEDVPYNIKIKQIENAQVDVKTTYMRKSSVETRKEREKLPQIKTPNITRSKSRQITKRLSVNKSQNDDKDSKTPSRSSIQNDRQTPKKKIKPQNHQKNGNEVESPPNKLPPMHPTKKTEQKQRKNIVNADYFKLITQPQKQDPKKFEQDVKSTMSKVFDNLLTVKNDSTLQDDQLSFDLSDEEDVRVNTGKSQQKQIVDSYKTKLDQLIQWMKMKYSPNMEIIMERTMEMDSNTFAQIKKSDLC